MPEAILGCFSYQMDTACHWAIVKLFPKIHGNGRQASKGSVAGSNSLAFLLSDSFDQINVPLWLCLACGPLVY